MMVALIAARGIRFFDMPDPPPYDLLMADEDAPRQPLGKQPLRRYIRADQYSYVEVVQSAPYKRKG